MSQSEPSEMEERVERFIRNTDYYAAMDKALRVSHDDWDSNKVAIPYVNFEPSATWDEPPKNPRSLDHPARLGIAFGRECIIVTPQGVCYDPGEAGLVQEVESVEIIDWPEGSHDG